MIFIDTGAFLAKYLSNDQYHARTVQAWAELERTRPRLYTSNFVLDETFTLLARRAGYHFAAERARIMYASKTLNILRPRMEDEQAALDLFEKCADQNISFTDCISFVLMKFSKLKRVFGFDQHFRDAGFDVWPT